MDESKLIELSKKHNKKALSILLSQNYSIVYGYLLKLSYNEEIAKDVTQETMVKAILNIDGFNGKSKFSTWLIQIANNYYLNLKKRDKRLLFTNSDVLDVFASEIESIEDQYIKKDRFINVMKHLQTYKASQRMPFILKHYYGYSYDEIATILNCPIGTVRSRIHNTIKKLQGELKGD